MKIQIDTPDNRCPGRLIELARVPCVGEYIDFNGYTTSPAGVVKVTHVIHIPNAIGVHARLVVDDGER